MKSSVSFNSFITIRLCFGQHLQNNNNCILGHNDMYLFAPREEHCCLTHTLNLEVFFLRLTKYRSLSMKAFSYLHTDNGNFHDSLINRHGLYLFLFNSSIYVLYMYLFKVVEEKFRLKHLLKINFNFVPDLYIFSIQFHWKIPNK